MALLSIRGLTVRYGATLALDGVDLEIEPGEIHALVGENGAGKSTVLGVIAGILRPQAGWCEVQGGARVAWAPQEPSLAAELTAAEWIFLGRERRGRLGVLRRKEMQAEAARGLREIGCAESPRARLADLPPATRKQVQLARALAGEPELLLLDEPSAVLASREVEILFAVLRRRRDCGLSTIYVTHRLDEVRAIADRVTVLRDGRRVSTDPVAAVEIAELVRRMVGREIAPRPRRRRRHGETALRADGIAAGRLRQASFVVRRGEIVGLAGLVGAGRSELLEAVDGLSRIEAGRLERVAAPKLVPEDRGANGLIPTFGVRENLCLPASGWLRRQAERAETRRWIDELAIRCGGPDAAVSSLSGGNQQKVVLARALRQNPELLLLDEPTAGVDVGAKAEIHDIIRRLADGGTAILLASSDLPELLQLSDRILALRDGRIAGELSAAEASEAEVAALITGAERL